MKLSWQSVHRAAMARPKSMLSGHRRGILPGWWPVPAGRDAFATKTLRRRSVWPSGRSGWGNARG